MKSQLYYLLFLLNFSLCSFSQNTIISPSGVTIPNISLQSVSDITTVQNPIIAQLIYNSNSNISGSGAKGIGFYFWDGTIWKSLTNNSLGNNITMPPSSIVLSEVFDNIELINNNFSFIGNTFFNNCNEQSAEFANTTNTTNAPTGRTGFSMTPTEDKVIIWGGSANSNYFNTGGVYDTNSDSWTTISAVNAPSARYNHSAVWTGSKIIVWGGVTYGGVVNTGAIFNPIRNEWVSNMTQMNAPSRRFGASAVWTGRKMIVWGGANETNELNDGGIYDPNTDSWTSISTVNAPIARSFHSAIWTGKKMIVWGGYTNTGAVFDPENNTWTAISTTNAPSARQFGKAIWTGDRMIVWGDERITDTQFLSGTGGIYNPESNTWISTNTIGAPFQRSYQKMAWTGCKMVVWGGSGLTPYNDGIFFDPYKNQWENAFTFINPGDATGSYVWLKNKLMFWGGFNGSFQNTGGVMVINSLQPKTFFMYKKN